MSEWNFFNAPSDAWWYAPLAWSLVGTVGLVLLLGLVPRRYYVALTAIEKRLARSPAAIRWGMLLLLPVVSAAVPVALIALAFGLRTPKIIALQSVDSLGQTPAEVPSEYADYPRLEVQPLLDTVLVALAQEAKHWQTGTAEERAKVREATVAVLRDYIQGTFQATTQPRPTTLPRWIEQSVEMTIVQGLARDVENVVWLGVQSERQSAWKQVAPLLGRKKTRVDVMGTDAVQRPHVKLLFDGKAKQQNSVVAFRALVENRTGTAANIDFTVGNRQGTHTVTFRKSLTTTKHFETLDITEAVSGFGASDVLVATAEQGTRLVPLPLVDDPNVTGQHKLNIAGDTMLMTRFKRTWEVLVGQGPPNVSTSLHKNFLDRGLAVPTLTANEAVPTLELLTSGECVVLAPNLSSNVAVVNVPNVSSTGTVPIFSYRVSDVTGTPYFDSLLSVTVPRLKPSDPDEVPGTAPGMQLLAYGKRVGSTLGERRTSLDVQRPVVELGQHDRKAFVRLRVQANEHALLLNADGTMPDEFDPSRSRAMFAEIIAASHQVLRTGNETPATHEGDAGAPTPTPLLTEENHEELQRLGRRTTDTVGLLILGLYWLAAGLTMWFWKRP